MCWTYFKTIGHRPVTREEGSKPPLQTFSPPWKNLLGIAENYWTLFEKFGPLSENSSPRLVFQVGYGPG